ncbi:MAG: alginate export family protein [Bacteroidaceae bacterium]|nr:alginate export family protein [Bacteroidaceae bacterium]
MNIKRYSCLAALLLCCIGIRAQESAKEPDNQLTLDAQVLARGEIRRGGFSESSEGGGKGNFVVSRTRMSVDYQKPGLELKVTAQHVGVWGQSNGGSFNVFEAFALLKSKQGLFAKIGRQELSYDDERVIGSDDWTMAASSHDVLKLGYEGHGHQVHGILAYNQNGENTNGGTFYKNGAQPYKTMHTLWYHYDIPRFPLGASLLFMNIGTQYGVDEATGETVYQQLIGGYVNFHPRHWNFEGSYYKQMGRDEKKAKLDAWMASAKLQFMPNDRFGFVSGFDYLSGDPYFAVPKPGQIGLTFHETLHGFNPLYGSHHQFYGAMDFFYVSTFVGGFSPGLQNFYVGGNFKPLKQLELDASYHFLSTATKLQGIDMTLGHEFELSASYKFTKDAKVSAGYSFMMGTDTMTRLKRASNDNDLHWLWLTLTVSPRIFQTRW